ncbi:hypothetical protein JCM10212_000731 [Sporobolomyces blumeae]
MVVWLLKLIIVSLNIRSTHKALTRHAPGPRATGSSQVRGSVSRKKRLKREVVTWVVWVSFLVVEQFADRLIGWLPLYSTFKAFLLLMVLAWRGAGSQILFDRLIKPTVKPWEPTLDWCGFVLGETLEIAIFCLLLVPRWIAKTWKSRKDEPDVPSILRGLRQHDPPSRIATSLARSLERTQEDSTTKINERLSQPVQLRINRIEATKPRRPPSTTAADPSHVPDHRPRPLAAPRSLPPPAFSTAPFRPITVSPARTSVTAVASAYETLSNLPPAPTRLPVSSASRLAAATPPPASIYPSLDALATTKPVTSIQTAGPPPPSRTTFGARETVPEGNDSPASRDPRPPNSPPRRRTRPSESSAGGTASPAIDVVPRPPRSPPSAARTSANAVVPPTPAPPGAFALVSPLSTSTPDVDHGREPSSPDVMEVELTEPDEGSRLSRPRRSGRKSAGASHTKKAERSTKGPTTSASKRALVEVETDEVEEDTPRKKKIKSSPTVAVRRSDTKAKRKQTALLDSEPPIQPDETAQIGTLSTTKPAATPRQKALGAISQLAADLLDDGDDGESGLRLGSPKARPAKLSVLARSTSSARTKGTSSLPTLRGRRAQEQKKGVEDGDDADYNEEPPTKIAKPSAMSTSVARRAIEEGQTKTTRSTSTRTRATASTTSAAPPTRTRTNRSLAASESTIPTARATTRKRPSSRATSPAPPPKPSADPTDAKEKAPKRKARRVLLGRPGGAADVEGEVEVEGVAVRRRNA